MAQNSMTMTKSRSSIIQLIPVMLCFFCMGFVDLVGTASNFVKSDLNLTDSQANIMPSLVFFWFLIFSVPTGLLMNKIGRKNTVMVSLIISLASLVVPIFGESYIVMLLAFSFLGIGNAILQTSLNPLVSNLIAPDRLASTLTFGQFVKAIASFLAPIIASWGALTAMVTMGLGWKILFPIYAAVCILSIFLLGSTSIDEERPEKASSILSCIKLLGNPFIFLCFLGIMCHVGIDVGTNTTAPKIIIERLGLPIEDAAFATSVYFIFRTIGSFTGSFILSRFSARNFFLISVSMMLIAMAILYGANTLMMIYVALGLIGYGNSNIFSIVFSQALNSTKTEQNEVSGLMIMGLFGGTLFPLAMGLASDAFSSQNGAVSVMLIGVAYLLLYTFKIRKA